MLRHALRHTSLLVLPPLVLPLLAGCADAGPGPGTAPQDTSALIHPATVSTGDTIAGLRVSAVDVRSLPDEPAVWTGTVHFQGELTLDGVYVPHFDHPEVDALCFHPDPASATRLPRFAPDARTSPDRKRWFCFRNPDAVRAGLSDPAQPREARVQVRDYTVHRSFTDAWDEADLVRVLETGQEREHTLRSAEPQPGVELGR